MRRLRWIGLLNVVALFGLFEWFVVQGAIMSFKRGEIGWGIFTVAFGIWLMAWPLYAVCWNPYPRVRKGTVVMCDKNEEQGTYVLVIKGRQGLLRRMHYNVVVIDWPDDDARTYAVGNQYP